MFIIKKKKKKKKKKENEMNLLFIAIYNFWIVKLLIDFTYKNNIVLEINKNDKKRKLSTYIYVTYLIILK